LPVFRVSAAQMSTGTDPGGMHFPASIGQVPLQLRYLVCSKGDPDHHLLGWSSLTRRGASKSGAYYLSFKKAAI
jgi:hypothetical protein